MADEARGEVRVQEFACPANVGRGVGGRGRHVPGRPGQDLDERGHRLVVRYGHAELPRITTRAGAIEVRALGSTNPKIKMCLRVPSTLITQAGA